MQTTSILSKKTKAEIVKEYENLLQHVEEIKANAQSVYQPQNLEVVSKIKSFTIEDVNQSFNKAKAMVDKDLADLSHILNDYFSKTSNKITEELRKFDELQQAIAISKKTLEVQYNIQLTAETLEQLISEGKAKKKQITEEIEKQKQELDTEIVDKRRDWDREKEEYEYQMSLQKKRDQESFTEDEQRQEKQLKEKRDALAAKEQEIAQMQKQISDFPNKLEKELKSCNQATTKQIEETWKSKLISVQKDWEAEKRLLKTQSEALQQTVKRQDAEIIALKKEMEAANKKVQELAVKVIESGASNPSLPISGQEVSEQKQ